jgi:signal transduction histidine kinase
LWRKATDLLAAGPLASLVDQLAAPLKDRTISQLALGDRTFMTSIVTFRGEDGEALGRILTLSDISQIRRLAMEKERFIRTRVHELKSPLGAVRSLLEVVTDKSLGEDLDPYLPMLQRAQDRIDGMVQLISDLLSLSRSEQARAAAEPALMEVGPAVDAAIAQHAERLTARHIVARTDLLKTCRRCSSPPTILSSSSRISSATPSSTTGTAAASPCEADTKATGCAWTSSTRG